MNLMLTLRSGFRDGRIEVTVAEGVTVTELATRLAAPDAVAAAEGPLTLRVLPLSQGHGAAAHLLEPDAEVRLCGLRCGDEVAPVPAGPMQDGDPLAVLHVARGPDAGRVFPLRSGANVIGRDVGAAVPLRDPLVAGRHASIHVGEGVEVHDLGSTGGISVAGTPATRAPWRPGETLALGSSVLRLEEGNASTEATRAVDADVVNGPPLVLPPLPTEPVELPEPPAMPEVRSMPRAALLAPALMGLAMFGMTGRATALVLVFISPLVMLAGVLDSRWERRRRLADLAEQFETELQAADASLVAREPEERAALEARFPSTREARDLVVRRGAALWARRPEHPEFLAVRLGTGDVGAAAPPQARQGGVALADARERVAALAMRGSTVPEAPVTASLTACGSLGFAGAGAASAARAVLLQVAALHAPSDCRIAVLGPDDPTHDPWSWTGWLPHVRDAEALLGRAGNATGRDRTTLLEAIEALVAHRAGVDIASALPAPRPSEDDSTAPRPGRPSLVVLVDDHAPDSRDRLVRLAERGPDHGVHVLWVARTLHAVPGACRTVLDTSGPERASVGRSQRGGPVTPVTPETCTVAQAEAAARMLAPLTDAAAVASGATEIPREVPLVALHGADVLDPRLHAARWSASRSGEARGSLRALVGQSAEGPEYLDLARDGPHALVGGTTGSGKSELLQAWILGMACAHGPESVTFLLVDYKGGAAFADCVRLPHSVGLVTDLDPRLAARVLASLRAELVHRERTLAAAGAKDIDALLASGAPAPPRLVVAIDEFATLVSEIPAFVDGVVDIAQRGRSLGLHLIMATQRPAGVIRDSLRANTNLRIALRMADEPDSRDVLGDAAAARLDASAPGRVLVRVGATASRQIQSAYGGAATPETSSAAPPIPVRDAGGGRGTAWPEPPGAAAAPAPATDAARVVDALRAAHGLAGGVSVRRPWLDELPRCLALEELPRRQGALVIGRVDDPARQSQEPWAIDLDADGAVLLVSGPGAGASTALRSLAGAAAAAPSGPATHVYGIDGGGGGLAPLRGLPHVGDIVDHDDSERVARLLGGLADQVRLRRSAAVGATSAPAGPSPRVLLLVDDAAQLQAGCLNVPGREKVWDDLRTVVGEGRSVGVHVAMTVARTGALHTSLRVLMTRLLLLRTAEEAEYALAGLRSARLPQDAPPGRGLDGASGLELQVAVPGGSPRLDVQARALAALAAQCEAERPPPVPRMPTWVDGRSMPRDVEGLPVLGVEEQSLAPTGVDMDRAFVIAGPAGSGRTGAVEWLATAVRAARPAARLIHLCLRRSDLGTLRVWTDSHVGVGAGAAFLARWGDTLAEPADGDARVVVVVEHLEDLGPGCPDHEVVQLLRRALRAGHAVVAEAETQAWVGPLASDLRAARRGLVLAAEPADVQVLLGMRGPRLPEDRPPGRGVLVQPGKVSVVQVPRAPRPFSTDPEAPLRPVSTRG